MRYTIDVPWIPSLGVRYTMGIDGISLLLVLLTTLWASSPSSPPGAPSGPGQGILRLLLLLRPACSASSWPLDFFLFYVFWEVMLVPMYFLIGVWGGPRKLYAAIKFFLYTLAGSVLMLLAILALYFQYVSLYGWDNRTFELLQVPARWACRPDFQYWVFLAFFLGFAIKVPMFPFHTWLPDAHVEAPTAGSVILAGVLLKMGTYGFVRFSLPLFPDATREFLPWS